MIPKYEEINGNNGYELEKFVVFDVPREGIPFNLFKRIERYLSGKGDILQFNEDRNITSSVYLDYILIEYTDKDIRDKDIKNNNKINIINPIKSEKIDGDRQLAENVGNFEYNGKYYLVLNPYNAFTDETDPEKGVYKGVIIDSNKYFEVHNQTKETNQEIKDILDN